MSRRDPLVYVHQMLDHAREAWELTRHRSRDDLDADRVLSLALVRLMEVVGEASRRVPGDFRSRFPELPWAGMIDLRNRLIHAYDEIDFDIVWSIVQNDLPPLITQLEAIISEQDQSPG